MSRKVLLWCDEETTVQTLSSVLAELKVHIDSCQSAEDAESRLREERFDAVIVDLDPDDPQAAEVLRRARKSSLNRTTLAITVIGSGVNVRDVFALGANFLLYKPVSADRARASLKAAYALMGRERRRNLRLPVHSQATFDHPGLENGQATLVDLSEEGTAIQSASKLPPSCKVYFKFELPDQPSVVRLSAEVVWQDSAGRVGMRFIDVPQSSRRLLREWLSSTFANTQAKLKAEPQAAAASDRKQDQHPDNGLSRLRASPGNRRTQSRRPCLLGAEIYKSDVNVPHRCSLSDISLGGCYVEMPTPFASGEKVEVQVRMRDVKLRIPGVVSAVHPGFGMGVRFELRNADQKDRLQQLIHQLEGTAQGLEYGTPTGPR